MKAKQNKAVYSKAKAEWSGCGREERGSRKEAGGRFTDTANSAVWCVVKISLSFPHPRNDYVYIKTMKGLLEIKMESS